MEAAVRHLRVTSSDDTAVAPFLLIRDTVHALGYHALCCENIYRLHSTAARNSAMTPQTLVLALDQQPAFYRTSRILGRNSTFVIDLFSDPFGWLGSPASSVAKQAVAWRKSKAQLQPVVYSYESSTGVFLYPL